MSPLPRAARWLALLLVSMAGGCTETISVEPISPADSNVTRRALDLGPGAADEEPADGETPAVDAAADGASDAADALPDAAVDAAVDGGQNEG